MIPGIVCNIENKKFVYLGKFYVNSIVRKSQESYKNLRITKLKKVDLFFFEWAHSLWEIDRKNFKWLDCIYKFNTSRDMWGLTNKERHQNIDDAFVICADYKDIDFTNKNILIVDDIYTTGATIEAVAKVLQKHKALRIDALTLASGSF